MLGVLATHLIREGFAVVPVADGAKVVERVIAERPDIVLLDLVLPGLGGFDVLEKLKRNESTKAIPVVILSNLGSEEDVRRGKALGATAYFVKANSMTDEITRKAKEIVGLPITHQ